MSCAAPGDPLLVTLCYQLLFVLQAIRWMEENFCARGMSVVVVTHDRAFMETVCTSVLEMEAGEVVLHSFGGPGSYARFREVGPSQAPRPMCLTCLYSKGQTLLVPLRALVVLRFKLVLYLVAEDVHACSSWIGRLARQAQRVCMHAGRWMLK